MDLEFFVKNIKFYCSAKGVKPTVACREAGVGQSFINNMELKGSVPSVEKVEMLAHYLGVTVSELIGEVGPESSESARSNKPPFDIIVKYNALTPQDQKEVISFIEFKSAQEHKKG